MIIRYYNFFGQQIHVTATLIYTEKNGVYVSCFIPQRTSKKLILHTIDRPHS